MASRLRAASSAASAVRRSARAWARSACGGLKVAQRAGLALVERAVLLLDDLGDRHARLRAVEAGDRGEEIVLRLHHVGGFDVEQRLPALHHVAGLGHQPGHPPGIGRKDRRRAILVDRDLAFGDVLGPERHRLDRLHAERRPLRRRRRKARDALGLAGDLGVRRSAATLGARPVLRHQHDDDRRHGQRRRRRSSHACGARPRAPTSGSETQAAQDGASSPRSAAFCRVYSRNARSE